MRLSPEERDLGSLEDILEMCQRIHDLLFHKRFPTYVESPAMRAATERWIEIVGEASNRLSKDTKSKIPVSWDVFRVFRNELAHEYDNLDDLAVWNIATKEIPHLSKQITEYLKSPPS